ncbi:MAG: glycosyltransferase family 4 protein [Pseudomonadota bacterium]
MKLGYIAGTLIPSGSASSAHAMHMAEAIAKQGVAVTLYAKTGAKGRINPYAAYGVSPLFRLLRAPFGRVRLISGLARLPMTLLHGRFRAHVDTWYGRDAMGLWLAAVLLNKPVFFEAHSLPQSLSRHRLWARLMQHRNCRGVVVPTQALRDDLMQTFPFLAHKPMLVAPDAASPVSPAAQALPIPEWMGRQGHLQIGYTGSVNEGQGVDVIIALAQRLPEVDFHLIGGTRRELEETQKRAHAPNLHLHGQVPHALIPAYLARFHAVLAPYVSQTGAGHGTDPSRWLSPLKLFEYMAAGKAIICSDLPVLREVLGHTHNALLIAPDNPSAWVDAIAYLQKNPDRLAQLGQAAWQDFNDYYTWDRRATRILAFVQDHAAS